MLDGILQYGQALQQFRWQATCATDDRLYCLNPGFTNFVFGPIFGGTPRLQLLELRQKHGIIFISFEVAEILFEWKFGIFNSSCLAVFQAKPPFCIEQVFKESFMILFGMPGLSEQLLPVFPYISMWMFLDGLSDPRRQGRILLHAAIRKR